MISINILIISLCILVQAFFSGSEMMIISSNKLRIKQKIAKGSKGAVLALEIINNQPWFLATTSTGTNMSVIISSAISAMCFHHFFGIYGEPLTIFIMAPVILMFGEIIPRTIFQRNATEIAPKIAGMLLIASRIISPVTYLVFFISKLFYGRSGQEAFKKKHLITREDLSMVLMVSGTESDVQKKEKKLIRKVFHLGKADIADIMVPLVNVTSIPDTATVRDAIKIISQTGYSRLPVFKNRIDDFTGIIFARDLLDAQDISAKINGFMRDVIFVPELKKADELLIFFQKTHNSIAIAVDEYGGSVGIITLEDILEEVVGEIRDEHDSEPGQFVRLDKNRFLVNARMEIRNVNEIMNLNLPKNNYETIGGFLLKKMGKIPKNKETILYKNVKYTVVQSSKKAINKILVEKVV